MTRKKFCRSYQQNNINEITFNANSLVKREIIINTENDEIKNEITFSTMDCDLNKSEITLDIVENDMIPNEITLSFNEGNEVMKVITFNDSKNIIDIKENTLSKDFNCIDDTIMIISDPPTLLEEHLAPKDNERIILSNDPLTEMDDIISLEESSENVVCSTYASFQERIVNYEMDTYTKYVIIKTRGSFTSNESLIFPKRIHWWNGGNLHGIPYVIAATRYLSCRFGAPTHAKVLEKYNMEREKRHKLGLCKRYKNSPGSSKFGCPVKIIAHRLLIFPAFKGYGSSLKGKVEKDEIRQNLLESFKNRQFENRYTCILPDWEDHKFHAESSSNKKEFMDRRILQKIKMLINMGITDPDDIIEVLEEYAEVELNVKDRNRKRFYPDRVDIIHTINRTRSKLRCSDNEQEKIKSMKQSWGDDSEVYLRLEEEEIECKTEKNSPFLFVYQNQDMKQLFRRYGNNAIFVDAVHRTCQYIWPLFFLIVHTNVNYQIVGFFITQHESKHLIAEALSIIKLWNPDVSPKYGLVNRPLEELRSLEIVYPNIQVFLSSYHRNSAWERKLSRKKNKGVNQGDIFRKLKAVADANSEDELKVAITKLKDCNSYDSSSVKYYYEGFWQLHLRRWAAPFWPTDLYFEINCGIKNLSNDINYEYLYHIRREGLTKIIDLLIKNYLPKKIKYYKQENFDMNFNRNNSNVGPPHFSDYAPWVVNFLLRVHFEAFQLSSQCSVKKTTENRYVVSLKENCAKTNANINSSVVSLEKNTKSEECVGSETMENEYVASLDKSDANCEEVCIAPYANVAACTCLELNRTNFICKHIILVGLQFPELHLSKISSWLFREPIFHIDDSFLEQLIEEPVHQNEDFSIGFAEVNTALAKNITKPLELKYVKELKSLETMLSLLNEDHKQELYTKLKHIRETYSRLLRPKSYINVRKENMAKSHKVNTADYMETSDSFIEDQDLIG